MDKNKIDIDKIIKIRQAQKIKAETDKIRAEHLEIEKSSKTPFYRDPKYWFGLIGALVFFTALGFYWETIGKPYLQRDMIILEVENAKKVKEIFKAQQEIEEKEKDIYAKQKKISQLKKEVYEKQALVNKNAFILKNKEDEFIKEQKKFEIEKINELNKIKQQYIVVEEKRNSLQNKYHELIKQLKLSKEEKSTMVHQLESMKKEAAEQEKIILELSKKIEKARNVKTELNEEASNKIDVYVSQVFKQMIVTNGKTIPDENLVDSSLAKILPFHLRRDIAKDKSLNVLPVDYRNNKYIGKCDQIMSEIKAFYIVTGIIISDNDNISISSGNDNEILINRSDIRILVIVNMCPGDEEIGRFDYNGSHSIESTTTPKRGGMTVTLKGSI